MKKEKQIERKFLIKEIPDNLDNYESVEIFQGYLSMEPEVRVRKADEKCIMTIKQGKEGRFIREKQELEISLLAFEDFLNYIQTDRIHKRRYIIPLTEQLKVELDEYKEQHDGLYIAKVKFPSKEMAESFEIPKWFERDVTEDIEYNSLVLALSSSNKKLLKTNRTTPRTKNYSQSLNAQN